MTPLEVLVTTILLGIAAGGVAMLARALPWPHAWKAKKPLGCATCMGGHAAWLVMLVAGLTGSIVFTPLPAIVAIYFGATAIAAVLNALALPPEWPV